MVTATKSKEPTDEIPPDEISQWAEKERSLRALRGEGRDLPLKLIGRSPFQPRLVFDEQGLRELAATIAAAGVLQPIIVRPKGQRYELVSGERRLRAAKIAGLEKIPAIVRRLDDAQSRQVTAIENLQREDLNPIEEARAYQQLLKGAREKGKGGKEKGEEKITQEELARRLGVSQPHVANRLRLLGLPQNCQQRIISGEITASQARCLLPYKGHPKLLAAIEKRLEGFAESNLKLTADEFQDEVSCVVFGITKHIGGMEWNGRFGRHEKVFEPTDQQREELDIVRVDHGSGSGEERACNVKLWDKLQAAHVRELLKQRDQRQKVEGKRGKTEKGKASSPARSEARRAELDASKKVSAAEKKRLEQRERERAREQVRLYARKLWEWKVNWLRYLIHAAIGDPGGFESENLLRLLVYFSAAHGYPDMLDRRGRLLQTYLRSRSIRVPLRCGRPDLWKGIGELQNGEFVDDAARFFVAGMFYHAKDGPAAIVPEEDVAAIADFLCIDVQKVWKREQAGPLSESFWNLHTKEQLVELAKELKFKLDAAAPKTQMVKAFCTCKKPLPLPKEIAKARRPR